MRLNAIEGTSQSALLWVPLVCSRGVETQRRHDEDKKSECLRLEEELNEKSLFVFGIERDTRK